MFATTCVTRRIYHFFPQNWPNCMRCISPYGILWGLFMFISFYFHTRTLQVPIKALKIPMMLIFSSTRVTQKVFPQVPPPTPKTAGVAQFFRSHCLALGSELEGWERVGKSMAKSWENPWFNRLTMKNGGLTKVSQTNGGLTVTEMELINTFDRFSRVERIGWSLLLTWFNHQTYQ